jgi:hypothetical protein
MYLQVLGRLFKDSAEPNIKSIQFFRTYTVRRLGTGTLWTGGQLTESTQYNIVDNHETGARILKHIVEAEKSTFRGEPFKGQSVQQGSQWLQVFCVDCKDYFV